MKYGDDGFQFTLSGRERLEHVYLASAEILHGDQASLAALSIHLTHALARNIIGRIYDQLP